MVITGVISDDQKKIDRTLKTYDWIKETFLINSNVSGVENLIAQLENCKWFMTNVDAVVIGTPPKQHYLLTKACLLLGKHVLVEKPMMMCETECEEVNRIASEKKLVLNVMHSFQFASGISALDEKIRSGELGKIESIFEVQLTNRNRRLPVWYDDLPLGLFYDEAAHFFYSAIRFGGGPLKVLNAHAQWRNKNENTPLMLEAQLLSGEIPVQMIMNFNSPICEWGLIILGEKKIAVYDYFKDILVTMDNDGLHLAKDVLKVSLQFSIGFWVGFVKNGFKMLRKNLLYGHDIAIKAFSHAIETGEVDPKLSGSLGQEVVRAMNEVATLAHQ